MIDRTPDQPASASPEDDAFSSSWLSLFSFPFKACPAVPQRTIPDCFSDLIDQAPWPGPVKPPMTLPSPTHPDGPWRASIGGSAETAVFIGDQSVLRMALSQRGHATISTELAVLSSFPGSVPRVLESSASWIVTTKIQGTNPCAPGPWIAEVASEVSTLHASSIKAPALMSPRLTSIGNICSRHLSRGLEELSDYALRQDFVPTHGDIHTGNVLVENDHLTALIDFEHAALAPPERDLVIPLILMSQQLGIGAAREYCSLLFPKGFDALSLAGLLALRLDVIAKSATRSHISAQEAAARVKTLRLLANSLLRDPSHPAAVLSPT